jgi:hypothetical protein
MQQVPYLKRAVSPLDTEGWFDFTKKYFEEERIKYGFSFLPFLSLSLSLSLRISRYAKHAIIITSANNFKFLDPYLFKFCA